MGDQKKKRTAKEHDTYSDGYDSEGYKNDEEYEELQKLDELKRIEITEKRLQERKDRQMHKKIAERVGKSGPGVNSSILNSAALSGIDTSKRSQVDNDRIQHRKELENRREKYTKDSYPSSSSASGGYHMSDYASSHNDSRTSSTQGHGHHSRDRNAESQEFQNLVQSLTLPFDFLNKLKLRSNFKELVKGTYVKAKISQKYEIYKIEGVKIDEQKNCIFELTNGLKKRNIDMKYISNQGVEKLELCTYYEQNFKNEVVSLIKDKKKSFDELLTKKQEKSEKEKYDEINANLKKKIREGFFEKQENLNASELQTYSDFLRDRLLEIEAALFTPGQLSAKDAEQKLMDSKAQYTRNMEFIQKKIKLVSHQFVPIFTKNNVVIGSKISEQALNKKQAKIKDKLTLRKEKIEKLQQTYLSFETLLNMLSSHQTASELKESIKRTHKTLSLSSNIQRSIASIDSSDANISTLLNLRK